MPMRVGPGTTQGAMHSVIFRRLRHWSTELKRRLATNNWGCGIAAAGAVTSIDLYSKFLIWSARILMNNSPKTFLIKLWLANDFDRLNLTTDNDPADVLD